MSPPSFPLHCFSGKLSVFVDTPPPNRIENAISQRTAATRYLRMCTFDTGMPLMISRDAHRSNVTVRKHHKRRVSILFSGKSADLWILTGRSIHCNSLGCTRDVFNSMGAANRRRRIAARAQTCGGGWCAADVDGVHDRMRQRRVAIGGATSCRCSDSPGGNVGYVVQQPEPVA